MAPIFHIALLSDWEQAQRAGSYTVSTRGRSLAEEGFIHASRADQWTGVRDRFYADVDAPLVLLQIDPALLDVPVVEEAAEPGSLVTFPHIYGPLPAGAVVKAIPLPAASSPRSPGDTTEAPEPGRSRQASASGHDESAAPPPESFSRIYFREMFFNVVLLCVVIAVGLLGALAGRAVSEDGTGVGGVAGMAVGLVVAAILFRRRHRER